jgi:glycogen debranching enzyme
MRLSISIVMIVRVLADCGAARVGEADVNDPESAVRWLEAKSHELVRGSRREMKDGSSAFCPQAGAGYEAFWLRDYAYMLEGSIESFSDEELRRACVLFVDKLAPDGSGVDCVKFDGTAVYQPGFGTMGKNPVADGSMFTVAVAWHTHRRLKDPQLLAKILDRLVRAISAVPRNTKSGLVHIATEGHDRCPYGFMDTVRQQGDVLFCSLLLIEADRRLADLLEAAGRADDAMRWQEDADKLVPVVRETFWDDKLGLFRAATIQCGEPDLWGSAFAVYLGVASETQATRVAGYFKEHYAPIIQRGQLRHLPAGVYWQAACAKDTYQNGGYWATPIGWFVCALDRVDPQLADRTIVELVRDFQKRGVTEWVRDDHTAVKNYVASATMPLAGAREMLRRREQRAK